MNAATGLCEGCLRTIDEIAAWASASDDERCRILQAIRQRCEPGVVERSGNVEPPKEPAQW